MKSESGLHRRLRLLALAAALSGAVSAPPALAVELPELAPCLSRWDQAAAQRGLSPQLRQQLLPSLQLLPRVLELDRQQPEFSSTFAGYYSRRVTDARIERGRELLVTHAELLKRLTREFGVPGRYLVAFWGLETNYGGYLGNLSTLDALATLACDARRSDYFTGELLAALGLIEQHDLNPAKMRGSWAGAMGHTQFMPSNYARYGRDGDGDGRVDLFGSIPDALTSAAHFLQELGWERGLRWGREVLLPTGFPYQLAGRDGRRSLSDWSRRGVQTAFGAALPVVDTIEAALLVPAGHQGPAFLVYHNFDIIMRWNRSEFYALAVGRLADRLIGAGPLQRPPTDEQERIPLAEIRSMQTRLNELGFAAGEADGILGPGTRASIRKFQAARGLIADGHYSASLREALQRP